MRVRFHGTRRRSGRRAKVAPLPAAAGGPTADRPLFSDPPLDELALSRRAKNVLRALGCRTIGDVTRLRAGALDKVRNCGPRTRSEIIDRVRERGIVLGESPTISARAVVVGWRRVELWDEGRVGAWCLVQDLARHPDWIDAIEEWAARRVFRLVSYRRVGLSGLVRADTGAAAPRAAPGEGR